MGCVRCVVLIAGAGALSLLLAHGAMAQTVTVNPLPADRKPADARPSDKPAPATPPAKARAKRAQATPDPAPTQAVPMQRHAGPDQEFRECLQIWDKATHMTRAEWAATCRRVQNRLNTMTQQAQVSPGRRRAR